MHDLGTPTASPATDDPDVPWWVLGIAIAVALALAAALVWVLAGGARTQAEPTEVSHPKRWDRRVAPYVKVVERLRDLEFEHPVAVRFLPEARFEKTVTTEEKELTEQDRREMDRITGTMRALGLIDGKIDLFGAVNDASGAGILAYYSYDDQRITVRGTRLRPEVRSTVVHELTHALQDQHFAIGDRTEALRKASRDGPDSAAASVFTAIIEGDATRVQRLYRESLGPRQQQALDGGRAEEDARAGRRLSRVPTIVRTMFTSPYTLGNGLVEMVAVDGDNDAVDDLLEDPPMHENALLDPFEVLDDPAEVRTLPLMKAQAGEKEHDSGAFGVLTIYLMLAERLPVQEALAAVDGWGGDTFLTYEADGTSCVRLEVAGTSRAATTRLHDSLRRWAAATPDSATVVRDADLVRLDSCDPGAAAPRGNDASQDAITLVGYRAAVGLDLLAHTEASTGMARCFADGMVDSAPPDQLTDPTFNTDERAAEALFGQVFDRCVAQGHGP